MFTRFVNGTGRAQLEMEVIWLDAPEGARVVDSFGPFQIAFRAGEPLRDAVFRFINLPLDGTGRYLLRLNHLLARRRRELANEYFSVVQLP